MTTELTETAAPTTTSLAELAAEPPEVSLAAERDVVEHLDADGSLSR